ncbi:hypothetical protein [Caldimonas sp. KR1-144]|uniref:hypothetical protein n=1 Tax=Caldimonas sp. KR1-144 TaxID=3400911 RepID=UPI003C0E2CEB
MLCPPGGSGLQSELRLQGEPAGHHMDHGAGGGHDHGADHAGAGHADHGHEDGAFDKCNLCSAFCSLTPFVSEPQTLLDPPDLADAEFPALSPPAPSFVCGGQERPPRTI